MPGEGGGALPGGKGGGWGDSIDVAAAVSNWQKTHITARSRATPCAGEGEERQEFGSLTASDGGGCQSTLAGDAVGTMPRGRSGATLQTSRKLTARAHARWGPGCQAPASAGRNAKHTCTRGRSCNGATGCMLGLGCGDHPGAHGETFTPCAQPPITGVHFRGPVVVLHESACNMALRAPTGGARALAMVVCVCVKSNRLREGRPPIRQ